MWAVDGRVRVGVAWRGKGGGRGVLVVEHCCVPGMVLAKLFFVFFVAGFFCFAERGSACDVHLSPVCDIDLSLSFVSLQHLPAWRSVYAGRGVVVVLGQGSYDGSLPRRSMCMY